jgi:hypothetical protein
MIFHDVEEHGGNHVTKNQAAVPILQPIQPESDRLLVWHAGPAARRIEAWATERGNVTETCLAAPNL